MSANVLNPHTHSWCMNALPDVYTVYGIMKTSGMGLGGMTHHIWPCMACIYTRVGAQCARNMLHTVSCAFTREEHSHMSSTHPLHQ
jgi:hypothetical protein